MEEYFAHISEDGLRFQTLAEHAEGTGNLTEKFAKSFEADQAAKVMGLLHDCGKACELFQKRLKGENIRVDHSTGGTLEAVKIFRDIYIAACIAGHHAGLPDFGSQKSSVYGDGTLSGRIKAIVSRDIPDYSEYRKCIDLSQDKCTHHPEWVGKSVYTDFFYIHLLYSCLVDADFLDTEQFMNGMLANRGNYESLHQLNEKLDNKLLKLNNRLNELNSKRMDIQQALIKKAGCIPGLYTLTVPTGGGKTISSLAFALKHAIQNGLTRVIYVIPYTSIIEQTAKIFSDILGEENVLAHYSNADFYTADDDDAVANKKKLASENWDAPVIVTTSVQFFESFFANRPSRCRKLHNVVKSVIVFDEAQSLPAEVIRPCLYTVSQLVKNYGCTAVLCTATQPSLNRIFSGDIFLPGRYIEELCPDKEELYQFFRRVRYRYEGTVSDGLLVEQIKEFPQFLCIVNTKKYAWKLFEDISQGKPDEGLFCLTTFLSPRDRLRKLETIKTRLKENLSCRVIATSLIEAGVDVDFPVVWREMAGIDSIIQAGGRCNRENKRSIEQSVVHVFRTDQRLPGYIRKNVSAAERVMEKYTDIASPEAIETYFRFLFYTLKDEASLDSAGILDQIRKEMNFAEIASKFKVIEDDSCTVIIPNEENEEKIQILREYGMNRKLLRKLGEDMVNVLRPIFRQMLENGFLEKVGSNIAILGRPDLYDSEMGLHTEADLIF